MRVIAAIPILATIAFAQTAAGETDAGILKGDLARLEAWVGSWHFEGQWSNGASLWAQAEYRPLLDGTFLEGRVWVRDNGGDLYQRYRSVFRWEDDTDTVTAHTFNHDGSQAKTTLRVDDGVATIDWSAGTTLISERMELEGEDAMRWQVWATPEGGDKGQIMDGVWHKVEAEPITLPAPADLASPLLHLKPLLGGWEINAAWSDGTPLWARSEYRAGLAGHFVDAKTWLIDDEGNPYQRYESVFAAPSEGDLGTVVSFAHDGSVSTAEWQPTGTADNPDWLTLLGGSGDGEELRQQLSFESPTAWRWQVESRTSPDQSFSRLMDGRWLRQGPAVGRRETIDPGRFVAADSDLRSFAKERLIAATVSEVYAAWTTSETWDRLWGPPSASRFDLAIGGRYEWMFNGWLGSNGCQVLSYIPDRMVSFSWNAPPTLPSTRLARTWVVVETEAVDVGQTRVRLTHLGFGEGTEWDQTYAYFDAAWERVLDLMAGRLVE